MTTFPKVDLSKATPRPWRVSSFVPWYIIPGDEGMPVCSLAEFNENGTVEHIFPDEDAEQARNNAALIVQAVNSFDAMREALELAEATIKRLEVKHGPFSSVQGTLDVIARALAEGKGE